MLHHPPSYIPDAQLSRPPARPHIYARGSPGMLLVGMVHPVRERDHCNDADARPVLADGAWPAVAFWACLLLFFLWALALYYYPLTP